MLRGEVELQSFEHAPGFRYGESLIEGGGAVGR